MSKFTKYKVIGYYQETDESGKKHLKYVLADGIVRKGKDIMGKIFSQNPGLRKCHKVKIVQI